MVRSRRFLYSALVTLVFYALLAASVPVSEVPVLDRHQYALPGTGDVKADFLDILPAGELVRVTVNVTRGGLIDVHLVQINETYDELFAEGAFNRTAPIRGLDGYGARGVRNHTFTFENDGVYQYAVLLDNRPYATAAPGPDEDRFDPENATFAVVRARFTEERERAAILVGLLTTLPAILLPTYALLRRARAGQSRKRAE